MAGDLASFFFSGKAEKIFLQLGKFHAWLLCEDKSQDQAAKFGLDLPVALCKNAAYVPG